MDLKKKSGRCFNWWKKLTGPVGVLKRSPKTIPSHPKGLSGWMNVICYSDLLFKQQPIRNQVKQCVGLVVNKMAGKRLWTSVNNAKSFPNDKFFHANLTWLWMCELTEQTIQNSQQGLEEHLVSTAMEVSRLPSFINVPAHALTALQETVAQGTWALTLPFQSPGSFGWLYGR